MFTQQTTTTPQFSNFWEKKKPFSHFLFKEMLLFRLNEPKPVSHPNGLSTDRNGKHLPASLTGRAQLEEQKQ